MSKTDVKSSHSRKLLAIWKALVKIPHGEVDSKSLQELGISTLSLNIVNPEKVTQRLYFHPPQLEEFNAIPAYNIPSKFPRYRYRDDHANYHYETGVDLHHYFSSHLFRNQWVVPKGPPQYCVSLNSNWVPRDIDERRYGWSTGKTTDTVWLLSRIWEHPEPAQPHLMATLINDIEAGDKLVPTELAVLTQLIMAATKMDGWTDRAVYPVLLFSILGKQQARIIQGHFDGSKVIVQYSKLYDFREEKTAPVNLFLRWFMCTPVGNTRVEN